MRFGSSRKSDLTQVGVSLESRGPSWLKSFSHLIQAVFPNCCKSKNNLTQVGKRFDSSRKMTWLMSQKRLGSSRKNYLSRVWKRFESICSPTCTKSHFWRDSNRIIDLKRVHFFKQNENLTEKSVNHSNFRSLVKNNEKP